MPRTLIVVQERWAHGIDETVRNAIPDVSHLDLAPDGDLSREDLRETELLVLEVDPASDVSFERLEKVKRLRPELPVIVAIEDATLPVMRLLLRHGTRDVIGLPLEGGELASEIINVVDRQADTGGIRLAPAICFVGSLGRVGNTSIVFHLAAAIAAEADRQMRCCVIDLDIQSGTLAAHAGVDTTRSVLDLVEAEQRLDQDMVRNVATRSTDGLYILPAPEEIVPIEQVDTDQLLRVVNVARAEFDLVLLDMPPVWTNWSLSLAAEADQVVVVTRQSLAHLRQARRCIDLFQEVGIPRSKISAVVNRAQKNPFRLISVQDVADTLGVDVLAAIREDRGDLSQAIDQGKLVQQLAPKNVFARDVSTMAHELLTRSEIGR
ncbi:AAA family ATPase [Qipengyuania atrilutea]|uniref:P-loop NTPase n=1 Tax=Qipengyuania atrilutea TaxID=2744473 RepID=A0A850GZV0_9SPHN|nr:P-loop NTPase [Actirhodobacter atriluteus]NVD43532.1 P-loop NTPase [Actirhodobacter atriluteus]